MRYVQATSQHANIKAFHKYGELYFEVTRGIAPTEELLMSASCIGSHVNLINQDVHTGDLIDFSRNVTSNFVQVETSIGDSIELESSLKCVPNEISVMKNTHLSGFSGDPALSVNDNYMLAESKHQLLEEDINAVKLSSAKDLDSHVDVPNVGNHENDLQCSECEVIFMHETMYREHMRNEHGLHMAVTGDMHKTESSNQQIQIHCEKCDLSFHMEMYQQHMSEVHGESEMDPQFMVEMNSLNNHISKKPCDFNISKDVNGLADNKISNHLAESKIICSGLQCDSCGKTFTTRGNLNVHKRIHMTELPFVCDICGRGFTQKGNMNVHLKRHKNKTKEKDLSVGHCEYGSSACPTCGKPVQNRSLRQHLLRHTKKTLYQCSRCNKGYNSFRLFQSHKQVHLFPDGKRYKCVQCTKSFKRRQTLEAHKVFHSKEKIYKCKICLNIFGYVASFKKHQQAGCNTCICQICDKSYDSLSLYCDHKTSSCNGIQGMQLQTKLKLSKFTCNECDKSFENTTQLQRHQASHFVQCSVLRCGKIFVSDKYYTTHHKKHEKVQPFMCDICNKTFPDLKSLKIHKRVHTKRKHICPLCQKGCLTPSILRGHMLVHTGEKPHQCDICNMHFRRKNHLTNHMEIHNRDLGKSNQRTPKSRPVCDTCGKSFGNKQALNKHQFLHTNSKPFVCDICGKAFAANGSLKTHVSAHQGERRFKCTLCQKSYRANKDYLTHLKSHSS